MKTWMCAMLMTMAVGASAQNPIISEQYSADPTARVFNGKVYLYPSHDIPSPIEKLKEWFCMADYHVFSSTNLTEWQDHGVIVSQDKVPWVQDGSYTMWAPDCVEKDGKYYFYFPAAPKGEEKGFGIGVAVADQPEGPFMPMWKPIEGVHGIDPCVLIDKDGQAYIYWAGAGLHMAKLKPNMTELASEPKQVEGLPEGFKEGPFAFERNGKYYFTFPWVREKDGTETLAYAMLTIRWDLSRSRASSWMSRLRSAGPIIIASWNIRDSGISSITIMIIRLSSTRTARCESTL